MQVGQEKPPSEEINSVQKPDPHLLLVIRCYFSPAGYRFRNVYDYLI